MTRIQRIDTKANAVHFRTVARYLAEASLRRAEQGDTALSAACAHESQKLFAQARKLERKASQPFVWAATMPPFVLEDFARESLRWLLDNPLVILIATAIIVLAIGLRVIDRILLWREHQRAIASHCLRMARVRDEWPALMRQRSIELKTVAQRMERQQTPDR